MDSSMEEDQQNSIKFIRKLRKKLRQIERLEKAQREFTDEELVKLSCKHDIRENLQTILSTLNESDVSHDSNRADKEAILDEAHEESEHSQDVCAGYEDSTEDEVEDEAKEIPRSCPGLETQARQSTSADGDGVVQPEYETKLPILQEKKEYSRKSTQSVKSGISWKNMTCNVVELHGHHGYVSCTDASEEWILSGSRDTTVKLWSRSSGKELKNMGGHTGQVTAVYIIDEQCSNELRSEIDLSTVEVFTDIRQRNCDDERVVLSGSTDCSVRLWIIPSGLFVKSIYNYNPVSSLEFFQSRKYVLVGSSSGNMTAYDLRSSNQIYSSVLHFGLISAIKVHHENIITSSSDGSIKVWNVGTADRNEDQNQPHKKQQFNISSKDFDLRIQYSFDMNVAYIPQRYIHSFDCWGSVICFGDDGCNIKFWNTSTGEVTKVRNQKPGVPGITDGVSVKNDLLLSTSYDMDTGKGYINVRSMSEEYHKKYIVSFRDKDTPRLATLTTFFTEKMKYIVTGGERLLVWHLLKSDTSSTRGDSVEDGKVIPGCKVKGIAKPAVDSDASSDDEMTTDEEDSKWFWQKAKRPEVAKRDDDDSCTTDSESSTKETVVNKPSNSICNWCTII